MFTRDLVIYSGSIPPSGSAEDRPVSSSTFKQVAKWEIDPDDPTSIQFRIPSASIGSNNDRIAFYISGSGKVGIGTKDPETAFDIRDLAEDKNDKGDDRKESIFKADRNTNNIDIKATSLKTARSIGGVSFDGTGNINLPGVNTRGSQDTTGNAATATSASYATTSSMTTGNADSSAKVIVTADDASANHPVTFIDNTTPDGSAESLKASRNITVNPNTGAITLGDLTISFTQGNGRTTFGTITFSALDEAGRLRQATIDLA